MKKGNCNDCGIDTYKNSHNYYMVAHEVWNTYGLGGSVVIDEDGGWRGNSGMLCIKCLERRMGRKLAKEDLGDFPINLLNPYTAKLLRK